MFTYLRMQNFKGWRDTGAMRMVPLTLLFGANSSGKSSIGRFLLMLKQTVESPDRKAALFPGGDNSAVQLGSFAEMVHGRNVKNNIKFEYRWELPRPLQINDPVHDRGYEGDFLSFRAVVGGHGSHSGHSSHLDQFGYQLSGEDGDAVLGLDVGIRVEFLCEKYVREKYAEKISEKKRAKKGRDRR